MNDKHIDYIDLAKGFCIMLIVLYHVMGHYIENNAITLYLESFMMPPYFILSGLFFKTYEGTIGFLKRKTNKLLIPFFAFYLLTVVLLPFGLNLMNIKLNSANWEIGWHSIYDIFNESWSMNITIWFLLCLFIVNMLFYVFSIVENKSRIKGLSIILSILTGFWGYSCSYFHIDLPLFVDTAMTALPFFAFGYAIRKYTNLLHPTKFDKYNLLVFAACMAFWCSFAEGANFITNSYKSTNIILFYLCGLMGTIGILALSKSLHSLPIVSTFGRYSIIILLVHYPVLGFLFRIFDRCSLSSAIAIMVVFVVVMTIMYTIIPIMKKYCSYITAQKDLIPIKRNY